MLSPTENAGSGNKRILVAQAKSPGKYLISSHLADRGYEVQCAETFKDAIRAIHQGAIHFQPFHILIIDEDLPGEKIAFDSMRARSGNRYIKIILIASASPTRSGVVAHPGVDVILQRPTCEKDIRDLLAQVLGPVPSINASASSMCVLIVEDDGLSLELMRIILTKNGYQVELASTGMEAIEACKRKAFDLIFMDLQMPDMDGFITAAKIREAESEGRRVPIVALTASNISGQAHEKLSTEFARILAKPFQIQTILETIREFTGGQNGPEENNVAHETARIIDVQSALPHFGLDPEQYREILLEFQASLPSRMKDMEMDFRSRNIKDLARRAHNLKGVAANVGAMRLADLSARLDEVDDSAEDQFIREALDDIHASIQELQENAQETIDRFIPESAQP